MANRLKKAPEVEGNGAVAEPKSSGLAIVIPPINPQVLEVTVEGVTPLVVCAWSEKAQREMLERQQKKANRGKEARDPEAEYKAALYIAKFDANGQPLEEKDQWTGVPVGGIKASLVNACRAVADLPMTLAQRMVFIRAEGTTEKGQGLVRIHGEHVMYSCPCRLASGVAMMRFRPQYKKWHANLSVEFLSNMVSAEQVANLIELAGYVEGWCEHRPGSPKSHSGDFGRFRIRRQS
jgi:hypothetical protein